MKTAIKTALTCAMLLAPSAAMAQGVAYAFDLRFAASSNLFSFPVNDPMDQTQIGPVGGLNYSTFAMDFNTSGSTLHIVNHLPGTNALQMGTVDFNTGVYNPGPMLSANFQGANPTGLSVDPTDETFYLSRTNELFTVDPVTGIAASVGNFVDATGASIGTVIDIAVSNDGNLFAHVLGSTAGLGGSLWSVDKNTGVSSLVGFSGIVTNFAQGMDFDPTTNLLYAALYTSGGNGSYGIWDTTDGSFTQILALQDFPDPSSNGRELELAIRIPAPGTFAAMGFAGLLASRRRR
jgi:hypothetical protein